ncbi:MAG: recombinase family protein [Candidatus Omnitrophica bacterium]|nr:recombinase family protein [Candidatus Omnitrophota bacterium]
MKVALYARVSSEKQAEKDLSLPAQLKALREYALKRDWTIVHEYVDEAESARSADRPEFQNMIVAAKQKDRPFEAILVWKLNRFARNREDSIFYKSLLRKKGIQIISINENIEDNPTGRLLEGVIESMDEFYSLNLAQDTVRGMKENASRGFWNGGRIPYGYEKIKVEVGKNLKNKLKLLPNEAEIVRRVFTLCLGGNGLKEISKILNEKGLRRRTGDRWDISGIAYMLKNETYTGAVLWKEKRTGKIINTPGAHEAIISKEDFERVQELIKNRTRALVHPRALTSDHLLSTFLRCKKCGHTMAACGAKSGQYHYYTCVRYAKMGPDGCKQKLINANKLEAFIIKTLQARVLTQENIKKLLLMVNEEIDLFEKEFIIQIDLLKKQLSDRLDRRRKLYQVIEAGRLDHADIAPRIKELNEEIESIQTKILNLEWQKANRVKVEMIDAELKPYVEDLRETLVKGKICERKGFLRTFIKQITIDYPRLEIEYTLPLPVPNKKTPSNEEVLSIVQFGSPNRI